jgi:hypothetical protein
MIVLAGLGVWEELILLAAGSVVDHVEIAIEVGVEAEPDAIALSEDEAGIDGVPGSAIEALEGDLHAVGVLS